MMRGLRWVIAVVLLAVLILVSRAHFKNNIVLDPEVEFVAVDTIKEVSESSMYDDIYKEIISEISFEDHVLVSDYQQDSLNRPAVISDLASGVGVQLYVDNVGELYVYRQVPDYAGGVDELFLVQDSGEVKLLDYQDIIAEKRTHYPELINLEHQDAVHGMLTDYLVQQHLILVSFTDIENTNYSYGFDFIETKSNFYNPREFDDYYNFSVSYDGHQVLMQQVSRLAGENIPSHLSVRIAEMQDDKKDIFVLLEMYDRTFSGGGYRTQIFKIK